MAVRTKPKSKGKLFTMIKWNPVCEMPEFEFYLNPKPEPKPWWKFW